MTPDPKRRLRFSPPSYLKVLVAVCLFWSGSHLLTAADANSNRQQLSRGWEYFQGSLGSIWEIWRGDKATDNVVWKPVTLPHCFNALDTVDPKAHYYEGQGWYRTRLNVSNPFPNGRTLLHFDGSGQNSKVFIGTEKVAEHRGGYDEWSVDITEASARAAANKNLGQGVPLAVMCDNSRDAESIPSDMSDFTRYGGLYRHVYLVYTPSVSLDQIQVEPKLVANGKASVKFRASLGNPAKVEDDLMLQLKVIDSKGQVVQSAEQTLKPWTGEKEISTVEINSPSLWSPNSPLLYQYALKLSSKHGEQTLDGHFGIRSTEWVAHGPFKLNGERLLLRGTQYHQDHAGVGAAVSDEVVRQTFQGIKEMGANFVRLSHYQQSPLVLELCDQVGLLVWEEIPWCRGGLGGESYRQECRDMLTHMIVQHYNHPSVIMWGLGNEVDWPGDFETYDTNAIRGFMTELNTLSHKLDPSRSTCIRRCDFCKDIVDVYSPSIWAGWYSGRYTEYRQATEKAIADNRHFFHAEWGADSMAGRHSEEPEKFLTKIATGEGTAEIGKAYKSLGGKARPSKDSDWSESYAINLFDWHLHEQETMTNLTGSAMWIYKDFATPLRPENPVPRVNQKGVVERDGTPKESYYLFQSYWSEQPMLHIYGHTWPVRWGKTGEKKEVKVFSNCKTVELFVNGVSAGIKQRNNADFPAAGLHWMVGLTEGTNVLRAVGHADKAEISDQITTEYQTTPWAKPAQLVLGKVASQNDVVTIEARAVDKEGIRCLDAANVVNFGVTGDGSLLDNLGTAKGSSVVQLCNGSAQISLKLTGRKAVVSVASEGLPTQFIEATNSVANAISAKPVSPAAKKKLASKTASPAAIDVAAIDRDRVLKMAAIVLTQEPITITAFHAANSTGGSNDFYSNADYWWPDPTKPDGLPYVERDGESNPGNFNQHRMAMRKLRDVVSTLGAAYKLTSDERYARKAAELLQVFFIDPRTRMNPHMQFTQAVPGRSTGRSYGIIDGLHLIEIPPAIIAMEKSPSFTPELVSGLKEWFGDLADWMVTSKNGKDEGSAKNNHAVAYWLQVASFSKFTGDRAKLSECRRQFKEVFIPNQMAADGGFPLELKRTKPYAYSIFQLDNMTTLCQILSNPEDDLWSFELPDGRSVRKAVEYLYPYLADKSKWPLNPDVQAWEDWPARQSNLLFAGIHLKEPKYLELWKKLLPDPANPEVQRNIAITQPLLWLEDSSPARMAAAK